MEHSFNIEVAKIYGVEKAVLIKHFLFWIAKNAANRVHYHDGRYWTYNSTSALSELFPYMSQDTIKRHLKKLTDDGFLLKGNFNKVKMDRTCWYAFSDSAESIMQKCSIDCAILHYGECESAPPIPDIKPDIEKDNKKESVEKELSFVEDEYADAFRMFLSYRTEIRKSLKPVSYRASYERLKKLSNNDPSVAMLIVKQTISNGWQGLFSLKNNTPHTHNERQLNQRIHVTARDESEPEHDDFPF